MINSKKIGLVLFLFLTACFVNAEQKKIQYVNNESIPPAISKFLANSKPLTGEELKKLVSGNSILGHTCHSKSLYELYFKPDGTLIFRKNNANEQVYNGKWWIKGNSIFSQWETYKKKPDVNELKYYHLLDSTYILYNVNDACGPAGTFGRPFIVAEGDIFKISI